MNNPAAENALSASTDVAGTVCTDSNNFMMFGVRSFVASNIRISVEKFCFF